MVELFDLDIEEVKSGVRNKEFTVEEYISQFMERIKKIDKKINSFITINEKAIEEARKIDRKIENGEKIGELAGIAIGIKDNINIENLKTTCASKMLSDYVSPYDATVIKKLKENDGIIIGKLNLDEFAMGSTTEWSNYGQTHNPWNLDYVCGGSSGGSAASVAARLCSVSLGSDTGGSIRCPASFCSVVGLKPTYGLVSRYGLVSYSNSLEQIGPIGKKVSDVKTIFNVISGHDPKDNTTVKSNKKSNNNKKSKIGFIKDLVEGSDNEVSKCIYSAIETFNNLDYYCEETELKSAEYALASYYTIATAEASSNLARYDNIRYGFELDPDEYEWNVYFAKSRSKFGQEVKRRIIVGSYVLSSGYYGKYYLKAQKARSLIKSELKSLFKKYDVLISPTVPVLPFKIGEKINDPMKIYLLDVNTVIANLSGIPAISIPAGFSNNNLPIGIQIMADEFQEEKLFDIGNTFEKSINTNTYPNL